MKIHSDTLNLNDLQAALTDAGLEDVSVEAIRTGSRKRDHGFEVKLAAAPRKGRRRRNTGRYGAEDMGQPMYVAAATYDEHGHWMARLFERDPDAIVTHYDGRDNFHALTNDKYRIKQNA